MKRGGIIRGQKSVYLRMAVERCLASEDRRFVVEERTRYVGTNREFELYPPKEEGARWLLKEDKDDGSVVFSRCYEVSIFDEVLGEELPETAMYFYEVVQGGYNYSRNWTH